MTDQNQQAQLPPLERTVRCDTCGWHTPGVPQPELIQALRHIELLQEKINVNDCACAYEKPDDICAFHCPALAAANRRAEEAFNEGVEAAARYMSKYWGFNRNLDYVKRPTQPEQTQKEQGR